MRIDKYLKVTRIIKRRTVAKDVCDAGRVKLNGRPAKAGSELAVGDKLLISYSSRTLEIEVLELRENVSAKEADTLYKLLSEEKHAAEEEY